MATTVMFVDRPYLGPIIAGAVGKDVAVVVKTASCDWLIKLLRGFQLRASILVPETEATIRAHRGQRAVHGMESNGIDLGQKNTEIHTLVTSEAFTCMHHLMMQKSALPCDD